MIGAGSEVSVRFEVLTLVKCALSRHASSWRGQTCATIVMAAIRSLPKILAGERVRMSSFLAAELVFLEAVFLRSLGDDF